MNILNSTLKNLQNLNREYGNKALNDNVKTARINFEIVDGKPTAKDVELDVEKKSNESNDARNFISVCVNPELFELGYKSSNDAMRPIEIGTYKDDPLKKPAVVYGGVTGYIFCRNIVEEFREETQIISFNSTTLETVNKIVELCEFIIENANKTIYCLFLENHHRYNYFCLNHHEFTQFIKGIKETAAEILEQYGEKTTPAKSAPQQVVWLNEFGIIEFLENKGNNSRQIGQILNVLLGHDADNLRKIVSDMKTGNGAKNDPYNDTNRRWAENQKRKIGIK